MAKPAFVLSTERTRRVKLVVGVRPDDAVLLVRYRKQGIHRFPIPRGRRDGKFFLNGTVGKLGDAVAVRKVEVNLPATDTKPF